MVDEDETMALSKERKIVAPESRIHGAYRTGISRADGRGYDDHRHADCTGEEYP